MQANNLVGHNMKVVNQSVGAIQARDGHVYYGLFESTLERGSRVAAWRATGFGRYAEVLKVIFGRAAACVDGSVKGKGGKLQPRAYAARWLQTLKTPFALPDEAIEIKVGRGPCAAVLPDGDDPASLCLSSVCKRLHAAGLAQDALDLMEGQAIRAPLSEMCDLLEVVYSSGGIERVLLWPGHWAATRPAPGLAPKHKQGAPSVQDEEVLWRCADFVVSGPTHKLRIMQASAWLQSHIRDAWTWEAAAAGAGLRRIQQLEQALQKAPPAPPEATITIEAWRAPQALQALARAMVEEQGASAARPYTAQLQQLDRTTLYRCSQLGQAVQVSASIMHA